MRKDYEKQILDHNVEKFSLMVKNDIDMFSSTEILTKANKMLHCKLTLYIVQKALCKT